MSERRIQSEILLALGARGMTGWRQNVGVGWSGDVETLADGSKLIRNPRPLRSGLCNGSSDIIGLRRVTVTTEMVGATLAQFLAIEVKQPGAYPTSAQRQFLDFVRQAGGLAVVARSVGDLPC